MAKDLKALGLSLCLSAFATALPHSALAASVVSIVPATSGPSRSTGEAFTVTFDEDVTGVDPSDFTLSNTISASGAITTMDGSGAVYIVSVNAITGTGTLRLDLNASGTNIVTTSNITPVPGFTGGQVRIVNDPASPVPTLTEWAMILMGLMLAGGAALMVQGRQRAH